MEKVKGFAGGTGSLVVDPAPPRPPTPPAPPKPRGTAAAPGASWSFPTVGTSSPLGSASPNTNDVLDQIVDGNDGVRGAILASVDGFAIARSRAMRDEASHSAMLAAAVGLSHQLVEIGGGSQLRQLVVDHDAGLLLVWPVGPQRVLAVLASTGVDQRALRGFVQSRSVLLSGAGA